MLFWRGIFTFYFTLKLANLKLQKYVPPSSWSMLAVLALFPLPVCSLDTCKKTSKKKANKKQRVKGAKEVTAQKNSLNVFCMATANTPQHAYTAICSSRFGQQSKQAGSSAVHQEDQSGEGRKKRKDRREGGRIIEVKRVVCVCLSSSNHFNPLMSSERRCLTQTPRLSTAASQKTTKPIIYLLWFYTEIQTWLMQYIILKIIQAVSQGVTWVMGVFLKNQSFTYLSITSGSKAESTCSHPKERELCV